eukprot:6010632-Alexandrium_andersonii.AAC.1
MRPLPRPRRAKSGSEADAPGAGGATLRAAPPAPPQISNRSGTRPPLSPGLGRGCFAPSPSAHRAAVRGQEGQTDKSVLGA